MSQPTVKKGIPTDRERIEEIIKLRYLLLVEGMSQRKAAQHIGRAEKTVCLWVKQYGIREALRQAKGKQSARALKLDNSLPAFIAYLRIHHKELHRQLHPVLQDFQQPS